MANLSIRYKHYDLGAQPAGTIVETSLSCINNVRLLDDTNIALYKEGKPYRFNGGLVQKTPSKIAVPRHGHWHLIVDKEGLNALANSKVRIFRPAGHDNWELPATAATAAELNANTAPQTSDASVEAPRYLPEPAKADIFKADIENDALTGLPNRAALEYKLESLYTSGADLDACALVLISICDLKEFNDCNGRQAGDDALVSIAALIRKNINGNDCAARTGGLQFAVLSKCGSAEIAKMIASRLSTAISTFEHRDPATGQSLGALSAHAAVCMVAGASSAEALIQRAEMAVATAQSAAATSTVAYNAAS